MQIIVIATDCFITYLLWGGNMLRILPLEDIEEWAKKANIYANEQIKKSYTHETKVYEELKASDPHIAFVREGVEAVRALDDDSALKEKKQIQPFKHSFLVYYESVIANTSKYSLGNCYELALQAFDYILNNAPEVPAEVFKIVKADHAILVLNRIPDSDPSDPTTWGENAIICDPLSKQNFKAKDYISNNPRYFKNTANVFEPLDKHNTSFLHQEKKITSLKINFLNEAQRLQKILNNCQTLLQTEEELVKKEYGEKHKKTLMMTEKITQNKIQIALTQGVIENYVNQTYKDSASAEKSLSEGLDKLTKVVEDASKFSEYQLRLFAHKDKSLKSDMMNYLGIKSSTEYHLDEITNLVRQNLKKPK